MADTKTTPERVKLPPKEVSVGVDGDVRQMVFREVKMDKDYVWKLTFLVKDRIEHVGMRYSAAIVADPTKSNNQLEACYDKANSRQMTLDHMTGALVNDMKDIHAAYYDARMEFGTIRFSGLLLKLENKPFNEQLIQMKITNEHAQEITNLGIKLDECAIVLQALEDPKPKQ